MQLLAFVAAICLLSRNRSSSSDRDIEKGSSAGNPDEQGQDTSSSSRNGRKLIRRSTTDTGDSEKPSLLSRVKSFLFPKEDPDSLDRFVPHYRWTPIISGIVIPFSILLEIPGLTERWYIRTENGQTVETKPNPAVLDTGLACSLAFGLIANIALIFRFLEKRVKLFTLVAIFFLTLHDIINIIAVTVFGVEHRFDDGFTYGESFWMTVCSTIASTITNITLITDYINTPDFGTSGSGLTRKQRSLVIIVMVLLVYVAFGALCNTFIQDLTFIDGLYFTVVTIETVGFGDITPNNTGARVFTCCYMVFGIINIGVAIGMTRETILEGLEVGYRKRIRRMRLRRREARRFRRWEARWRNAVEWRLKEKGLPVWVPDDRYDDEGVHFVGLDKPLSGAGEMHWLRRWLRSIGLFENQDEPKPHIRGHPRGKHLNFNALSRQELEAAALEAGVPLEMFLTQATDHDDSTSSSLQRNPSRGRKKGLFRESSRNGWPSHPQTPTHAQIGRMAAMLTKFAFTVSGAHIHMLGHGNVPDTAEEEQNVRDEREDEAEETEEEVNPHGRSNSVWSDEHDLENEGGADGLEVDNGEPRSPASPQSRSSPQLPHLADTHHRKSNQWTKQMLRSSQQRDVLSYENYRTEMDKEERRAYFVKLFIAWSLFLVFWTLGSGIFTITEGWSYGSAMYFCFMTFTTTGYGDFSPITPAGRSVFVVWALLGIGTMTILISILQEAGSSKYKSAFHFRMFDNAVRKYRKRENEETARIAKERIRKPGRLTSNVQSSDDPAGQDLQQTVEIAKQKAQGELEKLPGEIIRQAQNFHEHMQYFVNNAEDPQSVYDQTYTPGEETSEGSRIPSELKALLDEIAELEGIGARAKREILQDEDAKKTLFMLSIERTLRQMINSAERALSALAERDNLLAAQQGDRENHSQERLTPTPQRRGSENPDSNNDTHA
ncbi:voltage-gated potassium channel [Panus rudis PR-1116 ss-1]|nr:voltage-gated potassium channel [Panus rudis PR-1116 ss-1]